MSKIANKPLEILSDVKFNIKDNNISIEGPKGKLEFVKSDDIMIELKENIVKVSTKSELTAMSGTTRSLLSNMLTGVSKGWEKKLTLVGVGYRAKADKTKLELVVGYSHPVNFEIPDGITIETPSQTEIVVTGIDKQKVGQVAADIRSVRPPEPYKGKGIKYSDEEIVKKEAKKKVMKSSIKNKNSQRLRRATKTRLKISDSGNHRISVHRSIQHLYLQLISPKGDRVITTISTNQKDNKLKTNNIESAKGIGARMADYIKKAKISNVAFDRSGYRYHGRVKAVAEALRENGVKI